MILIIFLMGLLFALFLLVLGYSQGSFPMAYLGMFVLLLLGLFLYSDGLQIESGVMENPSGSGIFEITYETHTTQNDPIVNIFAAVFFYIPLGGILLSTLFALRGWR